jgi:hypothetical protein
MEELLELRKKDEQRKADEKAAAEKKEREEQLDLFLRQSEERSRAAVKAELGELQPLKRAAKELEKLYGRKEKKQKVGLRVKTKTKRQRDGSESEGSDSATSYRSDSDEGSEEEEGEIKQEKKKTKKMPDKNPDKKSLFAFKELPEEKGRPTLRVEVLEELSAVTTGEDFGRWVKLHLKEQSQRAKEWLRRYIKRRGGSPQRAEKHVGLVKKALETFDDGG